MDNQWSQHGQKYQWFITQNREWVLMYITAKGHSGPWLSGRENGTGNAVI